MRVDIIYGYKSSLDQWMSVKESDKVIHDNNNEVKSTIKSNARTSIKCITDTIQSMDENTKIHSIKQMKTFLSTVKEDHIMFNTYMRYSDDLWFTDDIKQNIKSLLIDNDTNVIVESVKFNEGDGIMIPHNKKHNNILNVVVVQRKESVKHIIGLVDELFDVKYIERLKQYFPQDVKSNKENNINGKSNNIRICDIQFPVYDVAIECDVLMWLFHKMFMMKN